MTDVAVQKEEVVQPKTEKIESAKGLTDVSLFELYVGAHSPCSVFIYYKKNYISILHENQLITPDIYHKLVHHFYGVGFIKKESALQWKAWQKKRYPQDHPIEVVSFENSCPQKTPEDTKTQKFRNEFFKFAESKIQYQTDAPERQTGASEALVKLQDVVDNKILNWFFQSPLSTPLVHHSARVTYLCILFSEVYLGALPSKAKELLAISALIHELHGDPEVDDGTCISLKTLEILKEKKHPLPKEVIEVISQQDELYSGNGAPRKLKGSDILVVSRIFSIVNHYEHYRLRNPGGTRRVRHERAIDLMKKREADFDPKLFKLFQSFMNEVEIF